MVYVSILGQVHCYMKYYNFVINMKFQGVNLLAFANVNILTVLVLWSMSEDDFAFICVFFYFLQFLIVITVLIFHFTD